MQKDELIEFTIKNGLEEKTLDALADFFGFEGCGIGIVKDFKVEEYFLSSLFVKNKIKIQDLYKNLAYKTSVVSKTLQNGYYIAKDYQNDPNSNPEWLNTGLKSTVMIKLNTSEIAILAFASFKNAKDFDNEELALLFDIAKLLSYIVESYIDKGKLLEYLYALNSVKPIYSYKAQDIQLWVENLFKNVAKFIKTKSIFYFFPRYDMYYVFRSFEDKNLFYKLQEQEALNATFMYSLYKQKPIGPCGQKNITSQNCMLEKSNALFVPVYKNDELLSICAFAYDFDLNFQNDTILLLETLSNLITNQIENLNQISKTTFFYQALASANEIMISENNIYKIISKIIKIVSNIPQLKLGLALLNDKLVEYWVKDESFLKFIKLELKNQKNGVFYKKIFEHMLQNQSVLIEEHFIAKNTYPAISNIARTLGIDCFAAFPLKDNQKVVGALILFGTGDVFDQSTLQLFQNLTNNIANKLYLVKLESLRIKSEKKIEYLAYNDTLTQISNRTFFEKRLSQMISALNRLHRKIALLILDLDDFKEVNDNFGHDVGDRLLKEVAKRLKKSVRTEDTLARLGGDEFVLLTDAFENQADLENLAIRIISIISTPFNIGKQKLSVSISLGIAYTSKPTTKDTLFKKADEALYISKSKSKNTFTIINI